MLFRSFVLIAAAITLLVTTTDSPACPLCNASAGQSLAEEVRIADMVLFGTLSNPKPDPVDPTDPDKGHTDLAIEIVIKPHSVVKDKTQIVIPKYWPGDGKSKKYLIFFNVTNGKLDAYRGVGFPAESKIADYLKGALTARKQPAADRLKYFFSYLESQELEISNDSYKEFALADYSDVKAFATPLRNDKKHIDMLLTWLKDPNTSSFRFGLYGLLLGLMGSAEDAKLLRALLDQEDSAKRIVSGRDGVMAGYVMLDPKGGWEYVRSVATNPGKDFNTRYAGLRTLRFLWEYARGTVADEQLLDAMKGMIDQADMADMPIDDLWKWKRWELTGTVVSYSTKESHTKYPINNRAILRFCIAATIADPKNTVASEFVEQYRKRDARTVEFQDGQVRDALKLMNTPMKPN